MKSEDLSRGRQGKRVYLTDGQSYQMLKQIDAFFESVIAIPRIRHGRRQTLKTLINEEILLFAKYLRNEKKEWFPRISIT